MLPSLRLIFCLLLQNVIWTEPLPGLLAEFRVGLQGCSVRVVLMRAGQTEKGGRVCSGRTTYTNAGLGLPYLNLQCIQALTKKLNPGTG